MNSGTLLLLNAEYVQSIVLVRSFMRLGWKVVGFCSGKCTSGYASRFLDERYVVPNVRTETKAFETFFYEYIAKNNVSLIIPMIDDSAEFLSKNKAKIEGENHVVCASEVPVKFNNARNKQYLMGVCERYNVCHPRTKALSLSTIEQVADYVGFPAMIKPDLSAGARGITRVDNIEELKAKFPGIEKEYGACSLQQFVEQPDYYYNVMMYRGKSGEILADTVIKIRRYFPLQGGTSCYSETVRLDSICEECKKLLEVLDWHGFADFDVLEDKKTGELKIIEINPRVPSSLQGSVAAGVDFGKVFVADLFGGIPPKFEYKEGQQVRWMGLDVMWFIFSPNRFKFRPSWFRFFGKNVSYHDGSWDNPLPMLAGCLAGFLKYLDPEVRKAKLKK